MAEVDHSETPSDGRVARRQRNIDNVLDVVLEMFAEESLVPTIEQASKRSGLSLRSMYRYFSDAGELLEAVSKRNREAAVATAHLPAIGTGPLERRIDDFAASRLRLHGQIIPAFRATLVNAARHPRLREELSRTRNDLRRQFELQFAPELQRLKGAAREGVLSSGDLLTQMDSIDYLRRDRQMSVAETHAVLAATLTAILAD